jgi:hypothetical protein
MTNEPAPASDFSLLILQTLAGLFAGTLLLNSARSLAKRKNR